MNTSPISLLIIAAPPILGSFIVLAIASVGPGIWITHSLAILLGGCLALAGTLFGKSVHPRMIASAVVILTLIGLAVPMLGGSSEPERWIPVGPLRLYAAPLLLPSFIAACSFLIRTGDKHQIIPLVAVLVTGILLMLQPDASQVTALLVASVVIVAQYQLGILRFSIVVPPLALMALWTFSLPDPLVPVPYVEEVFALGLSHSPFAGITIIAGAIALMAGLWILSTKGPSWIGAVAAYYAVLFACSMAGITPAPLVGYGAGPILGFGLMGALLGWLEHQDQPDATRQRSVEAPMG